MVKDWKKNHVQIHIDDLNLDLKNPRIDTGQKNITESQVIKELLGENVLDLSKDIAENGYLAVSTLMVIKEKGKNIVIDGNRRLLATKVLHDPNIIKNHVSSGRLRNIEKISKTKIEDASTLTAIVYPKRKNAEHEMAILHLTGIAIQQWKPLRQYRYFQKRLNDDLSIEGLSDLIKITKNIIKKGIKTYQLYEIAKRILPEIRNIENESIYDDKNFKTDKFQRAVLNEEGERFLGCSFSDEKQEISIENEDIFKDRLEKVLAELYNPDSKFFASAQFPVESRTLFFKTIQSNFLGTKAHKESIKQLKDTEDFGQKQLFEIDENKKYDSGQADGTILLERSDKNPTGLFIASNVPYKLKNSSIGRMHNELKNISVENFPNATHDLLRSFLECSLAEYLTQIGEYPNIKKNDAHNPKLGEMLNHVVKNRIIDDQHILDNLLNIKCDWSEPYSLERMNRVNHNKDYASSESDVRVTWCKLESFFKIILNPKKQK